MLYAFDNCSVEFIWSTWLFSNICRIQVLFVGSLKPLFGLLVTSALDFQARVESLACMFSCMYAVNSSGSPLVRHLLTAQWSAWQLSLFDPHTYLRASFCHWTLLQFYLWQVNNTDQYLLWKYFKKQKRCHEDKQWKTTDILGPKSIYNFCFSGEFQIICALWVCFIITQELSMGGVMLLIGIKMNFHGSMY